MPGCAKGLQRAYITQPSTSKVTKGPIQHSQTWLVGPLVTLACLTMICRPFGDLSHV